MQELLELRPNSLRGKRVLVTGGCGFVGSHIADLLVEAGCSEVTLLDNMARGRPENAMHAVAKGNVRIVHGDIRDAALMSTVVPGADIVFHQAALRITHCAAEPRAAFDVMAKATFDLLEACVEHKVSKVVMASSASIYGMAEAFPTDESHHPYGNRTLYGACKTFGESLLRSFNEMYGLDYVALRYFNVYGPRMDLHGKYTEVLIRWIDRLASGMPPVIFGDGKQTMDMIHVRDVARANILAANSPATNVALNIGSGEETSLLGLARLLADVLGRPDLQPVHEAERAVNPVPRRLAAVESADQLIGFRASVCLEEGIGDLVDWWMSEQNSESARVAAR
jgi:UDP-glucose 4-epimerase